jgi:hypothetical protein
MAKEADPGQDFEIYHYRRLAVEEAEGIVEDLEERLEVWRDELSKRQRRFARLGSDHPAVQAVPAGGTRGR